MFVFTLVAVGAATAAWLRPLPEAKPNFETAPTYTAQQVADAKSEVCVAYGKVHAAVDANAARNGGSDPTAQLALTTNMRQIYVVGSAYLLTTLSDNPATPTDLATNTSKLAKLLQVLTIEGSVSEPKKDAYDEVNALGEKIQNLCK